jgi:hypothetical protein
MPQAHTVAKGLPVHAGVVSAVVVPHDCVGRVHQLMASLDHLEERRQVVAAAS